MVPTPAVAKVKRPPLVTLMNSASPFAGLDACTAKIVGVLAALMIGVRPREGSTASLPTVALTDTAVVVTSSVWPSGWAALTIFAPSAPAAPGRLSTITCCPSRSDNRLLSVRAMVSAMPPAPKATTSRTGRVG